MRFLRLLLFGLTLVCVSTIANAQNGGTPTFVYERDCSQDASLNVCNTNAAAASPVQTKLVISRPNFPVGAATVIASNVMLYRRGNGSLDCASSSSLVLTVNGSVDADDNLFFANCPAAALFLTGNTQQQWWKQVWFSSLDVAAATVPKGRLDTSIAVNANTATLNQAALQGPEITSAVNKATAVLIGNGTQRFGLYGDPTGPQWFIDCGGAACTETVNVLSGNTWQLTDSTNTTQISLTGAGTLTINKALTVYSASTAGVNLSTSATNYFAISGLSTPGTICGLGSGGLGLSVIPGTFTAMHCRANGAPGVGKSYVFTLELAPTTDTLLTCTVTGAVNDYCDAVAPAAPVVATGAADESYCIKSAPSGTPPAEQASCVIRQTSN